MIESNTSNTSNKITRLEVINDKGRVLVRYLKPNEKILFSLQDEGKTLKIFLETKEDI